MQCCRRSVENIHSSSGTLACHCKTQDECQVRSPRTPVGVQKHDCDSPTQRPESGTLWVLTWKVARGFLKSRSIHLSIFVTAFVTKAINSFSDTSAQTPYISHFSTEKRSMKLRRTTYYKIFQKSRLATYCILRPSLLVKDSKHAQKLNKASWAKLISK